VPSRWLIRSGAGRAIQTPGDWTLLARYCLVGASGYAVNLAVYLTLVRGAGVHYLAAAACSFLVAVTSNYTWNRLWTFRAQRGRVGRQGARFLVVSTAALAANLVCLRLLHDLGLDKVEMQALAIALVTPISFLGNKLWAFATPAGRPRDQAAQPPLRATLPMARRSPADASVARDRAVLSRRPPTSSGRDGRALPRHRR
jgi:putative flippase GtrA